jgi:phage-related baseplate assembly protein
MSLIDLSQLPAPTVVETLDFETILANNKQLLVALYPTEQQTDITQVLELESEPLTKLLQVFAYRELLLRARVNDAAKAVMLSYATGTDLDQIGANYNVERLLISAADTTAVPPVAAVYEEDTDYRSRIQMSLDGLSVAGPASAYQYHALSADGQVLDVGVTSPSPGEVVVSVISRTGSGIATGDLIATVNAALNADDIRPLTDFVTVQSAEIVPYAVVATLYVYPGPDSSVVLANARSALESYVASVHRIGRDVPRSGLYAALHQSGVQRVELTSPMADIAVSDAQASYCQSITLTLGGVAQ